MIGVIVLVIIFLIVFVLHIYFMHKLTKDMSDEEISILTKDLYDKT